MKTIRMVGIVLAVTLVIRVICVLYLPAVSGGFRPPHLGLHASESTPRKTVGGNATAAVYRYGTADEMRYILYGDGAARFSPYDQHLLDYIRGHITRQSPTRPRSLKTRVRSVNQSTANDGKHHLLAAS